MSRVSLVDEHPGDPIVAEIFGEVRGAFGRIPNLFRAYAAYPPLLRANWEKVKAVMMGGTLRREAKEAIALLVSKDNGCAYCVAAHTAALRGLGLSAEQIASLETDLEAADFTAKEKALIAMAREANCRPLTLPDAAFAALRQTGADDGEIVEALGVMELFAAFNKFLDTLQVEIDF